MDVEERSSITPKMYLFLGIPAVVLFNSMRIRLRCNITIIIKCRGGGNLNDPIFNIRPEGGGGGGVVVEVSS